MCRRRRVAGLTEVFEANNKLIATPASDEIADTQIFFEPIRNLTKQRIANVMAKRVINGLEAI